MVKRGSEEGQKRVRRGEDEDEDEDQDEDDLTIVGDRNHPYIDRCSSSRLAHDRQRVAVCKSILISVQ
jgi:hypothetical protein